MEVFTMKAFFASALAFVMMLFSLITNPAGPDGIAVVHVSHSGFGRTLAEYKVDLARRNVWKYESWMFDYEPRDADARFEGYKFAGRLAKDKIDAFRAAAEQYGFADWEESYVNWGILDGHQWSVEVIFADGTKKVSYGSNDYPATWGDMAQAFIALTGENIL